MKTTPTQNPNAATKRLFRLLFDAQHKFEQCSDSSNPQVAMIISMIDQLLEKMLEYKDE